MQTVREAYQDSIAQREVLLEGTRTALAALEEHCPRLLDVKVPLANVYARSMSLFDQEDPEARALGVQLLEITGTKQVIMKLACNGRDRYTRFEVPGLDDEKGPFIISFWRERKSGCHKARVTKTKVIEFCGTLDEGEYDEVVYLDDDEEDDSE